MSNATLTRTEIKPRMKHPAFVLPDAMKALMGLKEALHHDSVPETLLELLHLRASQINGCSLCLDMHAQALIKSGESQERLFTVAAWRESPYFSEAERAALALTEALTRISDRPEPVTDEIWAEVSRHFDEQALAVIILQISMINFWNRTNIATRQPAGSFRG